MIRYIISALFLLSLGNLYGQNSDFINLEWTTNLRVNYDGWVNSGIVTDSGYCYVVYNGETSPGGWGGYEYYPPSNYKLINKLGHHGQVLESAGLTGYQVWNPSPLLEHPSGGVLTNSTFSFKHFGPDLSVIWDSSLNSIGIPFGLFWGTNNGFTSFFIERYQSGFPDYYIYIRFRFGFYSGQGSLQKYWELRPINKNFVSYDYSGDLDPQGNVLISSQVNTGSGNGLEIINGTQIDSIIPAFPDGYVSYILKLDTNGNVLWSHFFDIPGGTRKTVKVTPNGGVLLYGSFTGSMDFDFSGVGSHIEMSGDSGASQSAFLLKMDSAGTFQNVLILDADDHIESQIITLSSTGMVCIGGEKQGNMDLDPGPGVVPSPDLSNKETYIITLDENLEFISGMSLNTGVIGSGGIGRMACLSLGKNGDILLGYQGASLDLDPGPLDSFVTGSEVGANYTLFSQCASPTNLHVDDIENTRATLKWEHKGFLQEAKISFRPLEPGALWAVRSVDGSVSEYVLDSLLSGVQYEWRIKELCEYGISKFGWTSPDTFETQCAIATNLEVDSIENTRALLKWVVMGFPYDARISFRSLDSGAVWSVRQVDSLMQEYQLENLESGHQYEWRVENFCDIDSSIYAWSSPDTFETHCVSPSNLRADSIQNTTALLNWDGFASSSISFRLVEPGALWSLRQVDSLATSVHLEGLEPGHQYEWRVGDLCNMASSTGPWTSPDTFETQCAIATNLGVDSIENTRALLKWEVMGFPYDGRISFRSLDSGAVWSVRQVDSLMQEYQLENLESGHQYEWRVQDFCDFDSSIYAWSSPDTFETHCVSPSNLRADSIQNTTALLNWDGFTSSSISFRLVEPGALWSLRQVDSLATSVHLEGLEPGHQYEWRVGDLCNIASSTGPWTSPDTFETQCAIATNLEVDSIENTRALLKWEVMGFPYDTRISFRSLDSGAVWSVRQVDSLMQEYQLENLESGHQYEWRVQDFCDFDSSIYGWSSPDTFETVVIPVGIEPLSENSFRVFPNPAVSGYFFLEVNASMIYSDFVIYNLLGEKITETQKIEGLRTKISLEKKAGIYILELRKESGEKFQKKIVVH